MTKKTYKTIQSKKPYLQNNLAGSVILGVDFEEDLIPLNIDEFGRLRVIPVEDSQEVNIISGFVENLIPSTKEVVKTYTATENLTLSSVNFFGDGLGEFYLYKNDVPIFLWANSYADKAKYVNVNVDIKTGDSLKIEVKNASIVNKNNNYFCSFFFYKI